jgi:adenylate cyclase
MSDKVFLQEMEATVAFFDIRQFSLISSQLGPVDIAVALRRYYEHVEEGVLANEGRIVKFMSDGVLSLFMAIARRDHAADALKMVRGRESVQQGWLEENARLGLPVMQYSVGIASGGVLYGELGTARQRAYDVLGNPVTLAIKLARMATIRGTPHLISSTTVQAQREAVAAIEVEGAELGTRKVRLYRLLSDRETAEGNS